MHTGKTSSEAGKHSGKAGSATTQKRRDGQEKSRDSNNNPSSGKKKAKDTSNAAIWGCPREEQIEELSKALLREYMHRKKLVRTLEAFDKEAPRTGLTIESRALMHDMMHTKVMVENNVARGCDAKATVMESLCEHRLTRRALHHDLQREEKEIEAECDQLQYEIDKLGHQIETERDQTPQDDNPDGKKEKKKAKEGKEKKKEKKEKKQDKEKKAAGTRSASAPVGRTRGWQPPGITAETNDGWEAQGISLINSDSRKNLHDDGARIGFGGRDWKPPDTGKSLERGGSSGGMVWDPMAGPRPGSGVSRKEIAKMRADEQREVEKARKAFEEKTKEVLGSRERNDEDAHAALGSNGGTGLAIHAPGAFAFARPADDLRLDPADPLPVSPAQQSPALAPQNSTASVRKGAMRSCDSPRTPAETPIEEGTGARKKVSFA